MEPTVIGVDRLDLTPFGMLVSGKLQARSWYDFDAGQARSSLPVMGFGWGLSDNVPPAGRVEPVRHGPVRRLELPHSAGV